MECIKGIYPLTELNKILYSTYNYDIIELEGKKYIQLRDAFLDALAKDYISIYGE